MSHENLARQRVGSGCPECRLISPRAALVGARTKVFYFLYRQFVEFFSTVTRALTTAVRKGSTAPSSAGEPGAGGIKGQGILKKKTLNPTILSRYFVCLLPSAYTPLIKKITYINISIRKRNIIMLSAMCCCSCC